MIIGLTGRSCSGKDRVAELMKKYNVAVIDEDKLGHQALKENIKSIEEAFGDEIIENGEVNRKKLGPIVFSDPAKLEALNDITHPWMVTRTLELCREAEKDGKAAIINAALLESMGFVEHCDVIILVYASYDVRLKRALSRDNISEENFRKRSESQSDIGLLALSSGKKVITIINNTTEEQLSRQVELCCVNIKLN